jgi:hypothetical protein
MLNNFLYFGSRRTIDLRTKRLHDYGAGIAQLVEHRLPKPRVAGSIPVARSNITKSLIK